MGISQPENTCQPTNIVDCLTHQIVERYRVCSKKRKTPSPPVRCSLLGPKWLIGCSPSAQSGDWLGSSKIKKERKKKRKILSCGLPAAVRYAQKLARIMPFCPFPRGIASQTEGGGQQLKTRMPCLLCLLFYDALSHHAYVFLLVSVNLEADLPTHIRKIHSLHSSLLISQTTIVVFKINSSLIFFQNYYLTILKLLEQYFYLLKSTMNKQSTILMYGKYSSCFYSILKLLFVSDQKYYLHLYYL